MAVFQDNQKFCVKWNEFGNQMQLIFQQLYEAKTFADVTLICENKGGQSVEVLAHRLVLSMCSPCFLSKILFDSPEKHPYITLDGICAEDLKNVLEFVYLGKVTVYQEDFSNFLAAAEFLRIDGIQRHQQRRNSLERSEKLTPLNLSKSSPTHPFEEKYEKPEVLRPIHNTRPAPNFDKSSDMIYNKQNVGYFPPMYPNYGFTTMDLSTYPRSMYYGSYGAPRRFGENVAPCSALRAYAAMALGSIRPHQELMTQQVKQPNNKTDEKHTNKSIKDEKEKVVVDPASSKATPNQNVELFTTPSGMVVSTAYGLSLGMKPDPVSISPESCSVSPLTMMSNMMKIPSESVSPLQTHAGYMDTSSSSFDSSSSSSFSCMKVGHDHHSSLSPGVSPKQQQKNIKYTPAQVRALVQSVDGVTGPFVPCKICSKVVKRERLRTHIYECHLINGEKIHCPYCNVALKSKGSYRVHVWRHRNGNLKKTGKIKSKQPKVVDT